MAIERLMRAEMYAYNRWVVAYSSFWHRLAVTLNRRVREHKDYTGVR